MVKETKYYGESDFSKIMKVTEIWCLNGQVVYKRSLAGPLALSSGSLKRPGDEATGLPPEETSLNLACISQ